MERIRIPSYQVKHFGGSPPLTTRRFYGGKLPQRSFWDFNIIFNLTVFALFFLGIFLTLRYRFKTKEVKKRVVANNMVREVQLAHLYQLQKAKEEEGLRRKFLIEQEKKLNTLMNPLSKPMELPIITQPKPDPFKKPDSFDTVEPLQPANSFLSDFATGENDMFQASNEESFGNYALL